VSSVICIALAWITWKKSSQRSMPSIEIHEARAK
jgi:hypothetical protein